MNQRKRIYSDFDPFRILTPRAIPVVPGGMAHQFPFFRPTQGPGTGPGSGGGRLRALLPPMLGPIQGNPS